MWPFKPKVELEVFCAEFYNSMVFRPAVSLKKDAPLVWDSALKLVQDVDYAIAQVEQEDFVRELNSLRVELFGLAWTHGLRDEQFLVRELLFTRQYLDDMRRKEIWETMADYNSAILASAQDLQDRSDEREALTARLLKRGLDEEVAHRLVARVETDRSWAERGAITMLGDTLRRRLGVTLGPEGQAKVEEIAERLYAEAAKKIGAVKVRAT